MFPRSLGRMATTEASKKRAEELVPQFQFERVLNHGESDGFFTLPFVHVVLPFFFRVMTREMLVHMSLSVTVVAESDQIWHCQKHRLLGS